MPKVVNSALYVSPDQNTLGSSFAKAGSDFVDTFFGKGAAEGAALRARTGYYGAQTAATEQKTRALADAGTLLRSGDLDGAVAAAIRGGINPETFIGGGNLVVTANNPNIPITDPRISKAQLGAGKTVGATPFGQGRELQNAITRTGMNNATTLKANDMTTARQMASEKYKADTTPYVVYDDDQPTVLSRAEAVTGGHRGAPLTKDQVVGGIIRDAIRKQNTVPPSAPWPAAGTTALPSAPEAPGILDAPQAAAPVAADPGVSVFSTMSPGIRRAAGGMTNIVHFYNPQTRQTFQSDDGGETVDAGGRRVPVRGSGLQQISEAQAVTQTQDNMTRQSIGGLPPAPALESQAARDAAKTSGLKSAWQNELNRVVGFVGGPQMDADSNAARQNLTLLAQDTRTVLAGLSGRAAVKDKVWADEVLTKPGWFGVTGANPDEQYQKVEMLTQRLRRVYDAEREAALDPNLPPADRAKYAASLRQLERVIGQWEAPVVAPAPADAGPPQGAVDLLRQKPGFAVQFDLKYGAGSAAKILGGQ